MDTFGFICPKTLLEYRILVYIVFNMALEKNKNK